MPSQQQEVALDDSDRMQRAEVWLDQAVADNDALGKLLSVGLLESSSRIRHAGQAVYLLQQSVEKAVKALMVADGEDEKALRRRPFVHDSLTIVLTFFERIINLPAYKDSLDPLLGTLSEDFDSAAEVSEYLEYVKGRLKDGLVAELAVSPPDQVRQIVDSHAHVS